MVDFRYRPDIDGLRGIAVAIVVLFHAGFGFSGGFVGVDVFFVISGYLITGLILKEQEQGRFSLKGFWLRRIRRIVPAATVMAVGTLAAGYIFLFPVEYSELASSVVSQQIFSANVFFWQKTGYFQGAAEFKPLLHMWSLAVEEQFYIVYPIVLVSLGRLGRRSLAVVLVVATFLSLGLSVWGVHHHPSATFFLLPTRAWELLVGGCLWLIPRLSTERQLLGEVLGLAGIASIGVASIAFDGLTPFPGLAAIVPCLGAALLIYSATLQTTMTSRVLASRPLVAVGLISYSLYLWHWPALAFVRCVFGGQADLLVRALAVTCSVAVACLSYWFVESPFRRKQLLAGPASLVTGAGIATAACILAAAVIVGTAGYPGRFEPHALAYSEAAHSKQFIAEVGLDEIQGNALPKFGDPEGTRTCLVWGDSHAMALVPGIDAACKEKKVRGVQATHSSTPPVLDLVVQTRFGLDEQSPAFNDAVVRYVESNAIDVVILSGVWSHYATDPGFRPQLDRTLRRLVAAGSLVALVRDVAKHPEEVPTRLARATLLRQPVQEIGLPNAAYEEVNAEANRVLDEMRGPRVVVIHPADILVDSSGTWRAEFDGKAMYRDRTHLSVEGGLRLTPLFEKLLDRLD